MRITHLIFIGLISLLVVIQPVQAAVFQKQENLTVDQAITNDVYLVGETVIIAAPITGELFMVGSNVASTRQSISRSLLAVGKTIEVDSKVGYNAWVAGATVSIAGEIDHDVFVAGDSVTIKEGTIINGDLYAGATELKINGTVRGRILANVARATINASIGQELRIYGQQIEFTGGEVGGNFVYGADSDRQPTGLDKVKINGKTEQVEPKYYDWTMAGVQESGLNKSWLINLLGSILLGAAFIRFMPKKLIEVTQIMSKQWNRSFVNGLLALIVIPILAMLLLFTLVGIKLGFIIFGAYIVLLGFVSIYGLFILGRWVLAKTGDSQPNWWARLLVGAVLMAVLTLIPSLNWIVIAVYFFALTLPGLGASLIWYRQIVK